MLDSLSLYQGISLGIGGGILILLVKILFSIGRIYQRFEDIGGRVQALEYQVASLDKTVTSLYVIWKGTPIPPQGA